MSPSLERSDDGTGSRKEERGGGAAEADSTGGQLGGRGRDWGFGPTGELSNTAATEGLRSQSFLGQPKMAIPILKGRENVDIFSKQMRVYAKLHRFETVFESDPYIEVGADDNDKETLMAQGVSAAMYEKQLLAWVFLSQALQSGRDVRETAVGVGFSFSSLTVQCGQSDFSPQYVPQEMMGVGARLVRHQNQRPKGIVHETTLQFQDRSGR